MLSWQGLFNSIPCPHYVISNHCGRPYCGYRHKKKDRRSSSEKKHSSSKCAYKRKIAHKEKCRDKDPKRIKTKSSNSKAKTPSTMSTTKMHESLLSTESNSVAKENNGKNDGTPKQAEQASCPEPGPSSKLLAEKPLPDEDISFTYLESLTNVTEDCSDDDTGDLSQESTYSPTRPSIQEFELPEELEEQDLDEIFKECLKEFKADMKPDTAVPSTKKEATKLATDTGKDLEFEEKAKSTKEAIKDNQNQIKSKKRVAHIPKDKDSYSSIEPKSKRPKLGLAEQLSKRVEVNLSRSTTKNNNQDTSSPAPGCKKRIAHTPKTVKEAEKTMALMGTQQQLHSSLITDENAQIFFPPISLFGMVPYCAKVPLPIRNSAVQSIYEETKKIHPCNPSLAQNLAISQERLIFEKVNSQKVYKSSLVNCLIRLRKEANDARSFGNICRNQQLTLKGSGEPGFVANNELRTFLRLLYSKFSELIHDPSALKTNSFPMHPQSGIKGRADGVEHPRNSIRTKDPSKRTCYRCKQNYSVDKSGFPIGFHECQAHSGKKVFRRDSRSVVYTCCGGSVGSVPCFIYPRHLPICPLSISEKKGYVSAIKTTHGTPGDNYWDIIGLDCEMVYTTHGSELARVTIVDGLCRTLLDKFVRPEHPVLDYLTEYSGITKELLESSDPQPFRDIQAMILTLIRKDTIIVGHGLDNDLNSLRLIHYKVVDTSILYQGDFKYKPALKTLALKVISKIIQENSGGHDSAEDAIAAMEIAVRRTSVNYHEYRRLERIRYME